MTEQDCVKKPGSDLRMCTFLINHDHKLDELFKMATLSKTDYNNLFEPQVKLVSPVRSSTTKPCGGVSLELVNMEGSNKEKR